MNAVLRERRPQAGAGMIEVLVSLLVVSVGLLGLAGLFMNGLKSANEGYLYSQVVALAYDMADRMRANPNGLSGYAGAAPARLARDCGAERCSATELAAYDLYTWHRQLDASLPAPEATIEVAGASAAIQVRWDAGGQPGRFRLDVTL